MSEAWVTLATNDTYAIGALVLAESLRRVGTTKQLHILITPSVTQPIRDALFKSFNAVTEVDVLDSRDEANLALIKRPELGVTFTKLSCWTLTQYSKGVFLDADTVVLQNSDELFGYPELSAAPDIGWPDCFNSGVFVFVPSRETYHALVQFGITQGSFDGGDQGLLNAYFHDWNLKGPSHRLPFIYNMSSNVVYNYAAAYKRFAPNVKIVHFLGAVKPWHHHFDKNTRQLSFRQDSFSHVEHVQFWWTLLVDSVLTALSPEVSPAPPPLWWALQLPMAPPQSPPAYRRPLSPPPEVAESLSQFSWFQSPAPPSPLPPGVAASLSRISWVEAPSARPPSPQLQSQETASHPASEWTSPPSAAAELPRPPPLFRFESYDGHEPAPQPPPPLPPELDIVTRKFGMVSDHFAAPDVAPAPQLVEHPIIRITFPLPLWLKQGGEGVYVSPPPPSWRRVTYHPPVHDDCPICAQEGPTSIEDLVDRWAEEPVAWKPPVVKRATDVNANLLTARAAGAIALSPDTTEAAQRITGLQQLGGEEHLAAWERGNIEYLGRDAWENIQKRLDESAK